MRRIFKTQRFARWAAKESLHDSALCGAVDEMQRGLIDADLGHGILKKRIGLQGRGKRGGARTIVATNKGDRWFFLAGFLKSDRENLDPKTLSHFVETAAVWFTIDLDAAITGNELQEICHEKD